MLYNAGNVNIKVSASFKTSESSVNKENKLKISTCSPLFLSFPKSKVYAILLCTIYTNT